MLTCIASPRRPGETFACGLRRCAGRRSRILCLLAVLALAAAAVPLLPGDTALAQGEQPLPPELQQPLPVQPGQLPGQQQPQQQQPQQQPAQPAPQAQPGAGADAAAGQRHGDWVQRCTSNPPPGASPPPPGKDACFLVQMVSDQGTRRPLLKITIGFFGPDRRPGAVVAMPLGIPLARGLQISVDGKEIDTVPFQVCENEGCQAFVPMSDTVVAAFKAGTQAQARVESTQGQDFSVPMSLKGFTAGYTAIQ